MFKTRMQKRSGAFLDRKRLPGSKTLPVYRPADRHELEAENLAERVLAGKPVGRLAGAGPSSLEREGGAGVRFLSRLFQTKDGGEPLDRQIRRPMESGFNRDFSGVRVHTGGFAARACRALGSQAFTAGSHVFFGAGRFSPATPGGRRLLAHELAHVAQQRNTPAVQMYGRNVHYEHTKTWAEDVFGRGSAEAETIARRDQAVDEGWSHPHITTPAAFLFPVSDNDLRHFPSRPTAEAAVHEAMNRADPAAFGWALHRYQDSFSHSFPPGAPLSDLSHARDGATGIARDALLQIHRLYPNTNYGRGAAVWHALLGYYPDDYRVNPEQMARDGAMERGSRNYIRMFYTVWRTVRMIRTPVPPGLRPPSLIFGPQHVAPYIRRN
ncbi:MAG: DUF4157 domain-containing protein [Bacillota bacterium]